MTVGAAPHSADAAPRRPRQERWVLVVCTANQCRSPMAEGLLAARAAASGAPVRVTSAGTRAEDGLPPTSHAVTAMAERGIDITALRSSEVDERLLADADLVLVMTRNHRDALAAEFPQYVDRLRLMSELGGGAWDVADPIGGDLDEYRATASELDRLLEAGWSEIVGE